MSAWCEAHFLAAAGEVGGDGGGNLSSNRKCNTRDKERSAKKQYHHLTKEQRYTISVCLRKKMSATAIAKLINVSKSTISREIKRNLNMYRHYVWIDAQQFSDMRKHIPRRTRARTIVSHTTKQQVRRYSSKPLKISADERRSAKWAPLLCAVKLQK